VPAYTFPANLQQTAVMRIVVKNGFSMDLAGCLLADLRTQVKILEAHPRPPVPLVDEKARESFRH
jgi:glutamate decarboxylase